MRGFLGGVSVGAIAAAGGLAMWSLSVPLSGPVQEVTATPPAALAPTAPAPSEPASGPGRDADLAEALPTVPDPGSEPDNLSALEDADTAPAGQPDVGADASRPVQGDAAPADQPRVSLQSLEAGGGTNPAQPQSPAAPEAGSAVDIAAAPPPAPVQQMPERPGGSTGGTEAPRPGAGAADPVISADQAPAIGAGPQAPAAALGPANRNAPEIGGAPATTQLPKVTLLPGQPAPPQTAGAASEEEAAADEGTPAEGAKDSAGTETRPGIGIGTPVVPLTDRKTETAAAVSAPFAAFSEPFANPEARPLMSIVLIDGKESLGAEALADFPYPLSIAIDPEDPDAARKMAAHRAAGFEVLMLADLPRSAAPKDAEVALEVWRGKLPQALAILEGVETGIQGNRPLADQVADFAASAGYGLLTQNSGLNTVQKLALRDGVPAGVVFRDFDGAGQDPRAIRRFLDQAAFRAGKEGAVMMLGRLRPDTVSALLIWGLQDRASQVALAPVSAALEAQLPAK